MTRPRVNEADVGSYWIDQYNHVWVLETYCASPTVSWRKLDNGERRGGAVGSLITEGLERLVRAEHNQESERDK